MNNLIIKLGIRLFLFCLIAAVALAITNEVTKGPIAEQALASKMAALRTVMPNAKYEEATFETLEDGSELDELFVASNDSGEVVGYALSASPQGYGGEIPITFGVSSEGYVTQVYVGSLQETAGLGSKVGEDAFKEQFIGIPADSSTLRDYVDTISGASISSNAFLRATEDALDYSKDVLGITPAEGDKDAILAAYKASLGGEVEEEKTVTTETYAVTGFADFSVEISVDSDGKIVSVSVPEHNETSGFGADLIADASVFDALVGQNIADARIDVRAGATLTSNAINDALAKAAGGGNDAAGAVYDVTGFAPFKVSISVDENGTITAISVPEHAETPGLGADLIDDKAVFDALVGQNVSEAQIDVRAGVTLTSNAINDALKQAAKALSGNAPAGDPFTVKGMNKFTVYVELDNDTIASVSVPEHNETPGLGADLLTEEALSSLAGTPITDAHVDVVSGVTLTSNALNAALQMAALANGFEIAQPETAEPVAEPAVEETTEPAAEAPVETAKDDDSASSANSYSVTGFAPFAVEIAVDDDGKILSVSVPEHAETPGLGADLIADASVFDALVGQNVADAKIDVRAGVTLTSNAINDALAQAANEFAPAAEAELVVEETPATEAAPAVEETAATEAATAEVEAVASEEALAEEAATGTTKSYSVTGFAPFTVEVTVDDEGKITGISVPEHAETSGLGADLIADASVFDALVGQNVSDAKIDVRAGVTLTSNAINDALTQAAKDFAPAAEAEPAVEETPATEAAPAAEETAATEAATAEVEAVASEEAPAAEAAPETAGTTKFYSVTGFAPFTVEVTVDDEGTITGISVPEHTETPGLGADLIADASVFDALVGQKVADAKIDVRAGVTLTSNAINDALTQAASEFAPAAEAEPVVEETAATEAAAAVEETAATEAAPAAEETAATEAAAAEVEAVASEEASAEETVTATAGTTKSYSVTGFAPFTVEVTVDDEGKITGISVPGHTETPGLGADLIADASVFDALVGQNVAEAKIDVRAGVTLTSNAINEALTEAAKEFAPAEDTKPAEEVPAETAETTKTYSVTGFAPFTVEITVDGEGKISGVSVPEHTETAGLGADLIADTSVFDALVGQSIADAKIDVRAGVTLTSNAINEALAEAAKDFAPAEDTKPAEETPAETTGATKAYSVTGFAPFTVEITVDGEGKISSVSVPEHTETPGLGADLIADASVFEALVGQNIADAKIDVRAGVTLTSNAINDALKQAAEEVK